MGWLCCWRNLVIWWLGDIATWWGWPFRQPWLTTLTHFNNKPLNRHLLPASFLPSFVPSLRQPFRPCPPLFPKQFLVFSLLPKINLFESEKDDASKQRPLLSSCFVVLAILVLFLVRLFWQRSQDLSDIFLLGFGSIRLFSRSCLTLRDLLNNWAFSFIHVNGWVCLLLLFFLYSTRSRPFIFCH